jgi:hypothetical protein
VRIPSTASSVRSVRPCRHTAPAHCNNPPADQAHPDPQDLPDNPVSQDHLANPATEAHPDKPDHLAHNNNKDAKSAPRLPDQLDVPDHQDLLDNLANQDNPAMAEVVADHPDLQDPQAPAVHLANPEAPDSPVNLEHPEPAPLLVPDARDHLDQLAVPEAMDSPEDLANQEDKDHPDLLVNLDTLVNPVATDSPASPVAVAFLATMPLIVLAHLEATKPVS